MRITILTCLVIIGLLIAGVPKTIGLPQPMLVGTEPLTRDPSVEFCPAWSPDGSRIAFSSSRIIGEWVIDCIDADGKNQIQLTPYTEWAYCPAWNPNGTKIAFLSNASGYHEIWLMNSDGSNKKKLLPQSIGNVSNNYPPSPLNAPSWSPDGTKIAFGGWPWGKKAGGLWIINSDGTGLLPLIADGNAYVNPSWSPDGGKIAFQSDRSGNWDIWIIDLEDLHPTQLTNDPGDDYQPSWSPDGNRIAFSSNRTGNFEIWIMDADGCNPKQLTKDYSFDFYPSWNRDGKRIAYASVRSGNWDIWVLTLIYPPGEISLNILGEMLVGRVYNISVSVKNVEDIDCNFTVKLTGPGFNVSNSERNVYVLAGSQRNLTFQLVPQKEGNLTVSVALLHNSTQLDSKTCVVNVKPMARLICYPQNIDKDVGPGESGSWKITIKNEASVKAMNIEITKNGDVARWIESLSQSWFPSIDPEKEIVIDVTYQIPGIFIWPAQYTGSLIVSGSNFDTVTIPMTLTVGLPPTIILAILTVASSIIVAIIRILKREGKSWWACA